jgi:hypothetical protein
MKGQFGYEETGKYFTYRSRNIGHNVETRFIDQLINYIGIFYLSFTGEKVTLIVEHGLRFKMSGGGRHLDTLLRYGHDINNRYFFDRSMLPEVT